MSGWLWLDAEKALLPVKTGEDVLQRCINSLQSAWDGLACRSQFQSLLDDKHPAQFPSGSRAKLTVTAAVYGIFIVS
jgi:hypothetical protein